MPKMKTVSGAAKRFKKTANGFKHRAANRNHINTKMSGKKVRTLRGPHQVSDADVASVKKMLRLK